MQEKKDTLGGRIDAMQRRMLTNSAAARRRTTWQSTPKPSSNESQPTAESAAPATPAQPERGGKS